MDSFPALFIVFILAILTYLTYKLVAGAYEEGKPLDYNCDVDLTGKTVLITGSNCGLGKAASLDLAARGARVILACRNRKKAEIVAEEIKKETGNPDVSVLDLDLSDLDSVKAAAENVIKTHNRLDILINNAGIGFCDQVMTKQGFEITFGTNYLGHFLLTELLLDLLKKSAPSRIVNVSSHALFAVWYKLNYEEKTGTNPEAKYPNLQGYPISKLANYFHTVTLAETLKGTGVTVNAVHPGCVQTEIMKRDVKNVVHSLMNSMFYFFCRVAGRSVKDGGLTLVHAAIEPNLSNVTGEFFTNMRPARHTLTPIAIDAEEAEKLSKFSHEVCRDYLHLVADNVKEKKVEKEVQ